MRDGWKAVQLGEVCTLQRGFDLPTQDRRSGAFPLISSSGTIDTHDEARVRGPGVITGRSGSIGKVFYIEDDFWPLNTTLYVRDFHGVDPKFIYFLLSGFDLESYAGGTGVPTLNRNDVHGKFVNVPTDISEQQRIVAILDEAFEGIATAKANAEKNLQNAVDLARSHLDASLSHHGAGYVETTLGAEVELLPGYAFSSKGYTEDAAGVRLLRGDNIMQGYLRWEEAKYWSADDCASHIRFALAEGDVVLAMDRPWVKAGLKRAQISNDDLPSLLVQRTARLRPRQGLLKDFLFQLTGSPSFSRHLLAVQTGSGVPHISGKQIESFRFMKPPLQTQAVIAANVAELQQKTEVLAYNYDAKLTALDELKKSLLHQAFSGRL